MVSGIQYEPVSSYAGKKGKAMSRSPEGFFSPDIDLDRRQMTEEQEMMKDQELADRAVLARVRRGETHYGDFLYLVGRLQYNFNDLENNHD